MQNYLLLATIAFPLAGAALALAFGTRPSTRRLVAPAATAAAALVFLSALALGEGMLVRLPLPRLEPAGLFGAMPGYLADRLARVFLLLVGLTGLGGLLASADAPEGPTMGLIHRQGAALLLLAGNASLVLSANFLTAYLSWCLVDLAIVLMVLHDKRGQALPTVVINQLAGLALLFGALQARAGDGATLLNANTGTSAALLLLLAGLVRAGLYPLHLGLPLAPGGPPWSASLLRLLPTTSGLYLVMRALAGVAITSPSLPLLSGVSLVVTGLLAWLAPDEERALAYITANQVALAVLSLTGGHVQTDVAALAAAINLVLSSGLLFLTGGPSAVPPVGRTARWIRRLRVVAMAAVVGIPPALGFVGRWGLYRYAVEQGLWLLLAAAALGSSFVVASLRPLLPSAEGAAQARPGPGLTWAVALLGIPFVVLGLQPLLLSPALEAVGGPGTYGMLLKVVRTTEQSVGVVAMAAILFPLAVGYGLSQACPGRVRWQGRGGLAAAMDRVFHLLGLGWLYQVVRAGAGWLGRLAHSAVEPLEGERYLAWILLVSLLVILLLARYV